MQSINGAPRDEARGRSTVLPASGRDLFLELDLRRGRLRRGLRQALRTAIQEGRLAGGTRLPSSRRLALDLRVSRGVVTDTYDQLAAEGYLVLRARQAPVVVAVAGTAPPISEPPAPTWRFDFVASTPDVELFPRRDWLRATERALRTAPNDALDYGDHRGRLELRTQLNEYLARVRGLRVEPERIVVTQGFTQALDLLGRVLAARGTTTVVCETPSLSYERDTIGASGLAIAPCPVDADGLRTDLLPDIARAAVVVTPAHQFPTGAVMAPHRRAALLAWAAGGRERLVIEDDYDAEFRYDRLAVGALQGLDPGRVVHLGTASKTLAPGLRIGWMSLPAGLVDEIRAAKGAADSGSPVIDQLALADLLSSGAYDRHVGRVRHVYRRRRDRLVAAVARHLPRFSIEGAAAGLHVLLRLPDAADDLAVAAVAASRAINVDPLSAMEFGGGSGRGLLLGYGRLPEERIEDAVEALAACLREAGVAGPGQPSSP